MTRTKYMPFILLIAAIPCSNLLAQDTPQNIYYEWFKIDSDTTLVSDGTRIRFTFINQEKYLTELSSFKDKILADSLCRGIDNYEKCRSIRANHALSLFEDKFTELNGCIIFHLQKGDSLVLCNQVCDCEAAAHYELKDYLIDFNLFVVSAGYYEGREYLLVNPITGEKTDIWNEPLPSPDKNGILAYSYDAEMGYAPNGLQMWKKERNSIKIKWAILFKDWGPAEVFWADAGKAYLKTETHYFIENAPKHRYLEISIKD